MSALLKIKLGSNQMLEITSDKTNKEDLFHDFSFWSQLPTVCSACKKNNLTIFARKLPDAAYCGLRCADCRAEFTFHKNKPAKGGDVFFTPNDTFKVYQKEND